MILEDEIICPRCGSSNLTHSGWLWRRVKGENRSVKDIHRHICGDCGKFFGVQEDRLNKETRDGTGKTRPGSPSK